MARIAGVNIPNHQHAEIALTAIYGIGRPRAKAICEAAGVPGSAKIKDLTDTQMDRLREHIAKFSVQGDHYQFNAAKYAADPAAVTEGLRRLVREALACGYGNIDIDSSTLVDLTRPGVDEQQRTNFERAAELTALIRELEPAGL